MGQYSVLMSVYYKENAEFFRESINSILNQTIITHDIVVVCDGPLSDPLNQVLSEYVNQYPTLFQIERLPRNIGLGPALNVGLQLCKHELVARMDSDDIAYPDRCERQMQCFHTDPTLSIISATIEEFEDNPETIVSRRVLPQQHEDIIVFAKRRNPFNHPCVMFRKSSVIQAGGYKEFYLCEDYYLWIRMLQNGARGHNILDPLLFMRAGATMYHRRAGGKYLISLLKFRWHMKQTGFSRWSDFLISSAGQVLMCLLPNKLRMITYQALLRR